MISNNNNNNIKLFNVGIYKKHHKKTNKSRQKKH